MITIIDLIIICKKKSNKVFNFSSKDKVTLLDLIKWYKIMDDIDKVAWFAGPIIKAARGGYIERLYKEAKHKSVQRIDFISNRVVNLLNKLNDATVQAPSTNSFKNRADSDHNGYS